MALATGLTSIDQQLPGLILIVEDDPIIGELLHSLIAEEGFRPLGPVGSLTEGKSAIAEHALAAALVDIRLGRDERSFELAEILRALRIPFAFMSAYPSLLTPPKFRDVQLLRKPFTGEELASLLHQLVESHGNTTRRP